MASTNSSSSSGSYFQELMRLRQRSNEPLVYESVSMPVKMGNTLPIAFGGFNSSLAIQAAFHSLAPNGKADWAIYSATGLFLGPTALDRPVQYTVTSLRDTRSFATRFIIASQDFNGQPRRCFSVTVDFTRRTPASGPTHREARLPLSYSLSPSTAHTRPEELLIFAKDVSERIQRGELDERMQQIVAGTFGLSAKVTNAKVIKGGIFDETLFGILPRRDTREQLSIPDVTQRRQADWFQAKETLTPPPVAAHDSWLPTTEYALHASYLAFVTDSALSFLPLSQHGLTLSDAAACSTLDFALRFHDDDLDFTRNHLREMRTLCADRERTFSEAFVWNLDGRLVASMSQQCVLRPRKPRPAKL